MLTIARLATNRVELLGSSVPMFAAAAAAAAEAASAETA